MGRLIVLSGPSGAGKSPLVQALARRHPSCLDAAVPLVLYNDRAPRPGEVDGEDYHFRRREQIEALRDREGFEVFEVRGDLQALDCNELHGRLERSDVIFEGNPQVGGMLMDLDLPPGARVGIFLSPLGREELAEICDPDAACQPEKVVTDVMRRKLLRRTQKQKGILSAEDLAEVERRAGAAYGELQTAWRYDHVVVNHDGEDSENWTAFACLLGPARRATDQVAAILRTGRCEGAQTWPRDLPGPVKPEAD
jgi:guanylate kinase